MPRLIVITLVALYSLGCESEAKNSDTRSTPNVDQDVGQEETVVDVTVIEPEPDTGSTDPCLAWRERSSTSYKCSYDDSGLFDQCTIVLEIKSDNLCMANCDPAFYIDTRSLKVRSDGSTIDVGSPYNAVCTPVE